MLYLHVAIFSIIVPSYNQERFIGETLANLVQLKQEAADRKVRVELIVVDNCSDEKTGKILKSFEAQLDQVLVEPDKGQYDAINKGLRLMHGDYWTWLNTDDLLDTKGFFEVVKYLEQHPDTDYIYGNVAYIDEHSKFYKDSSTENLHFDALLNKDASISQPGSFFRSAFTRQIGELSPYYFAFDYEYILRCLKNKAVVTKLNCNVAFFRYYTTSKSGSQDFRFLKEQLQINQAYGGRFYSKLSLLLRIRILKRKLFN